MEENTSSSQCKSNCSLTDPLYYGTVNVTGNDVPTLESGSTVFNKLDQLNDQNKFLDTVLYAPDATINFFQKTFPEIVGTNNIGNLSKEGFNAWKPNSNDITIELDRNSTSMINQAKDVYIGGPAALFAASIQAHDKQHAPNVLYGHDGVRGLSNWKGSASYFHIRDAIPVYYWPDNSGVYTLYCTAKHYLQKRLTPLSYNEELTTDPNFNKLRLNMKCLLKDPLLFPQLFVKNFLYTVKDVNLHLTKKPLIKPSNSTAYTTMEHARLTKDIIPKLDLEKPILMNSNESGKALHLHLGKGAEEANNVFQNLQRIGGDAVNYKRLSETELRDRGYDPEFVEQGLEFTNDGYIVPYTDEQLGKTIIKNGGQINDNMRLKKILVAPTENGNDCKATKIVWENVETGEKNITAVKTLYMSLGPSVKQLRVTPPEYSLMSHVVDVLKSKIPFYDGNKRNPMYAATFKSLFNHVANKLTSTNLLHKTMWASGLSSTILVKVDKSKVADSKMTKFRDHIDAHNKHCVRLAEKEVVIDGNSYQMFVLQATGGGHFPIKDVHAEAAINVLKANIIPLLNLYEDGVEFEVISARSCARGICAQNVFRMKAPLANTVMIYGIGGIGITTMAPNALLMKAVLKARENLSDGKITATEFNRKMKESDFGEIPHWPFPNPFSRNYGKFIDSSYDPREVARKLGVSQTNVSRTSTMNKITNTYKSMSTRQTFNLLSAMRNVLIKMPK